MTPEAVSELYEAEFGPLTRSVERMVGDRHAAEDLVHDSFVAYLASSPGADRPGAWLSRVARNRALNHLRRPAPLPLVETASEDDGSEGGPEREAVQAVVARALGALHDRDRLALQLRFYEGLDYPQIAARLGARVEQTHVIVHRATRRLGREVVRRLARVHGASQCEDALAGMFGLASFGGEHGEGPCERCRPAWDEIGALRALPALTPLVAGPGMLRRMFGRIWTRAAGLADVSSSIAGAMVGAAVAVSSAMPVATIAAVPPAAERPSAVGAAAAAGVRAPSAATNQTAPKSGTSTTSTAKAPLNDPGQNTNVGGLNTTDREDHNQVEPPPANDTGAGSTGVVVCKPLEPCPPPPSPAPGS